MHRDRDSGPWVFQVMDRDPARQSPGYDVLALWSAHPGWWFELTLTLDLVVVGFRVGAVDGDDIDWTGVPDHLGQKRLTARQLHDFRFGAIEAAAVEAVRGHASRVGATEHLELRPDQIEDLRVPRSNAAVTLAVRPGSPGRGDLFYAELAAEYLRIHRSGSTSVVEDLARSRGWPVATIRNQVYDARRKGLLTRVGRGRAGGDLTEKARRLLTEEV